MRYFPLSIILFFCTFCAEAQETKRFQGPYVSGIGQAGEATYFYYDGKRPGDQIRHGSFRYTNKFKDGDKRLYQTVEGAYKHGNKDGKWSYNFNTRDFIREKQGLLSGNIVLKAEYKEGSVHGRWEYTAVYRHRTAQGSGSMAFSPEIKEKLVVHFNMGMLVDSFSYESSSGTVVQGLIPKNGMLHGNWHFTESGKKRIVEYYNGIIVSQKLFDAEDELISEQNDNTEYNRIIVLEKAKSAKTANKLDFTTDTLDRIRDMAFELTQVLILRIFNENYYLLNYIPGNKSYFSDHGKIHNHLKGLRTQNFKNQISPEHSEMLAQIKRDELIIKRTDEEAKRMSAGKPLNKEAQAKLQQLAMWSSNADRYFCIANTLCLNYEFEAAYKNANETCNRLSGIKITMPAGLKSRHEVLRYIVQQMSGMVKNATDAKIFIEKSL